jgi:hypothetical protein
MPAKQLRGPLRRWVDARPDQELDAHLGEIFRAVPEEEPLEPSELAAVGRRIARHSRRVARRGGIRPFLLGFAVLVGAGGVAFAEWSRPGFWHLRRYFAPRALEPAGEMQEAHVPKASVALPATRAESSTEATPSAQDVDPLVDPSPPAVGPKSGPARAGPLRAAPRAAETSAPESPQPSPIALESELLTGALAKLRRDHDPRGALSLLDDYQARFPQGVLWLEASAARVDALLLLGRRDDALAWLARIPLDRAGRSIELQLLRAELYAERDCGRAIPDFDAVLVFSGAPALAERALYGRAACRLRLGDVVGGRSDLHAYLARYPKGRFADQVRARLATP